MRHCCFRIVSLFTADRMGYVCPVYSSVVGRYGIFRGTMFTTHFAQQSVISRPGSMWVLRSMLSSLYTYKFFNSCRPIMSISIQRARRTKSGHVHSLFVINRSSRGRHSENLLSLTRTWESKKSCPSYRTTLLRRISKIMNVIRISTSSNCFRTRNYPSQMSLFAVLAQNSIIVQNSCCIRAW